MAVCTWCNLDMLAPETTTCVQAVVSYPDGLELPSVAYTHWGGHWTPNGRSPLEEIPDGNRCHDCGIAKGGRHHPGCDMERCPRCQEQLISCGCLDDDDDDQI